MCTIKNCWLCVQSWCVLVYFCSVMLLLPATGQKSIPSQDTSQMKRQLSACETGSWAAWGDWSECRTTCLKQRDHDCVYRLNRGCTLTCKGPRDQFRGCTGDKCCADGVSVWGEWGTWNLCPPCGAHPSLRSRTRPCLNNTCNHQCLGDAKGTELCSDVETCNVTDGEDGTAYDDDDTQQVYSSATSGMALTLKALLWVVLTFLTLVAASLSAVIVHKQCKKKPEEDGTELEMIDINLSLPRPMQGASSPEPPTVASSSVASSTVDSSTVASSTVASSTVASTIVSESTASPTSEDTTESAVDTESVAYVSTDIGQSDVYYHAPDFGCDCD